MRLTIPSALASLLVAATGAAQPATPSIVDRAHVDPAKGINFHALAAPDTVYVGQQSTYQVAVFLDEVVRMRLRRNPEFLPPELRGLLAYDLPAGRASLRDREIAGKRWDIHVFQRAVFPLQPGRTEIPGAQLTYSLPLAVGFFSREESYTARAERATIVAVTPPADGRPMGWNGAVGVLRVATRLDTTIARVGDSFIATLRVEGTGNVKLLPRPPLPLAWGSAVPGDERVYVDSTSLLVRGAKEFDWIVTPKDSGARSFPAVRYPYFDPYARRYDVAQSVEVPVLVEPGTLATVAAVDSSIAPVLSIRRVDRGAVPTPLPSRAAFWIAALLAPAPAAALVVRRRPRLRKTVRDVAPAVRLRTLSRDSSADVADVRRAFLASVAERLALGRVSAAVASARSGTLARRLRRAGATAETAQAAEALAHRLDAAAYASRERLSHADANVRAHELAAEALALVARLDGEARPRSELARRAARRTASRAAPIIALAATVGVVSSLRAVGEPSAFDAGVAAYEARQFAEAASHFADAAQREPGSPDAWANAGTAAWTVGDTLHAAVAWQRALRLEPRAEELRTRLELMPSPQDGWIAGVPALPLDWAAATGLALWIVACAIAAVRLSGRGADLPLLPLGAAAVVAAAGSVVLCVQLARVRGARDLAVVTTAGVLRAEPTLGAERTANVERTDVARIGRRESVWTQVTLDGARKGWIESDRLTRLAP